MLQKALKILVKRTVKLVFATSVSAAGAASVWGTYQEKEPEALTKLAKTLK